MFKSKFIQNCYFITHKAVVVEEPKPNRYYIILIWNIPPVDLPSDSDTLKNVYVLTILINQIIVQS